MFVEIRALKSNCSRAGMAAQVAYQGWVLPGTAASPLGSLLIFSETAIPSIEARSCFYFVFSLRKFSFNLTEVGIFKGELYQKLGKKLIQT